MTASVNTHTPRLGLALSGAAARSVFYIGFLEVLQEAHVPVSVIAAQSGAGIVASAYACGTLPLLKDFMLNLNWKRLRSMLKRSPKEGGLYSLAPAEDQIRTFMTLGKRFEDLETKLVFAATNLNTGEIVSLAMGDLARAIHATCAVPGLFAPVQWGNFLLIDGGLLSVMPGKLAREAGATVVVGVDAKATRHIFMKWHIAFKSNYNKARNFVRTNIAARLWRSSKRGVSVEGIEIDVEGADIYTDERRTTSIFHVLGRSLDLAIEATVQPPSPGELYGCDFIISEGMGRFGDSVVISEAKQTYLDGRRAAKENLQRIKNLLQAKDQT